jgi:hypothetical protein
MGSSFVDGCMGFWEWVVGVEFVVWVGGSRWG